MTLLISTRENKKAILVLLFLFILIVSSALTFSFSVFIIQVFLSIITIPLILKRDYNLGKLYVIIFGISMVFVFLIYLANYLSYGVPYYIGGSDDLNFENEGRIIIESGMINPATILDSGIIGKWHNATFYSLFISFLIRISDLFGGYSSFLPRIMNVYFLIWVCMLIEYLLKLYGKLSSRNIYISIAVFSLTPNIQYINSHVFRDTLNLLQVLLIVVIFDKLVSHKNYGRKIFYAMSLVLLIFITFYTRTNSLVFAGVICLFALFEKIKLKKIFAIVAIIPLILMGDFLEAIKLDSFIETYSNYVLGLAGDGLSRLIFEQPLIPLGIILRALYAFITPFPNFLGIFKDPSMFLLDFIMFLVYLGVVIQILTLPFVLKRIAKFDWLSVCFLILFLSVISTTFTFRHVFFYFPFMVALGVDGYMSCKTKTRKQILLTSGLIAFSLAFIYLALKLL